MAVAHLKQHHDEFGPEQARSTLARSRRYSAELKAQPAQREALNPQFALDDFHSGPRVNVDGTPMVGSDGFDLNGNPYGVTQTSHDPFGH